VVADRVAVFEVEVSGFRGSGRRGLRVADRVRHLRSVVCAVMPSSVRRFEVIEHREVFQVGRLEFRVARCGQIGATSLNQPKVVGEGN